MRYNEPETKKDIIIEFDKLNTAINKVNYKSVNLGTYIGSAIYGVVKLASAISLVTYAVMSFSYGPIDTGKVIYSELSGNRSVKVREFEEAKFLYATEVLGKKTLNSGDINSLFTELKIIPSKSIDESIDAISWNHLLDFNESNRNNYNPFN